MPFIATDFMLKSIFIKNFAIIERLESDFFTGMSALTGETGTGKSIIIDALNLALGQRADRSVARNSDKNIEVIASLDATHCKPAQTWLKEHDFDDGDDCVLRRVIGKDGKSKAYINGTPSSVSALRDIGDLLVNVYGQHEYQTLMRAELQRQLLDDFAGNRENIEQLASIFRRWQNFKSQLETAESNLQDTHAKLDLLRYQLQELKELNLQENEYKEINKQFTRLHNAKELNETNLRISLQLAGDHETSIYDILSSFILDIEKHVAIDSELKEPLETLRNIHIQTQEVANSLRTYANKISSESDPRELPMLEERIIAIEKIARKHKVKPQQLTAIHSAIENELNGVEEEYDDPEKLKHAIQESERSYRTLAKEISTLRKKAAGKLNNLITESMQSLGMQGGRFSITVEEKTSPGLSPSGLDDISFLVCTNPGQSLQALNKVASGGELSRLSLAIQSATSNNLSIPTLIFDEVDTGVGGATAEIVGKHLRKLGDSAQVFCVTHLPQVAAQAHHHYKVDKFEKDRSTAINIDYLAEIDRVNELARMLGGVKLTKNTREHAKDMLSQNKP